MMAMVTIKSKLLLFGLSIRVIDAQVYFNFEEANCTETILEKTNIKHKRLQNIFHKLTIHSLDIGLKLIVSLQVLVV